MQTVKDRFIRWPRGAQGIDPKFHRIAGFPSVCGAIDGTHVNVCPPKAEEDAYVNRHQEHSLNVCGVCGPDLAFETKKLVDDLLMRIDKLEQD